jgi:triacylglycerol lipase
LSEIEAPVVLLHGLHRSARSMSSVRRALEGAGLQVLNLDYPSARYCVADLAIWLHDALQQCCAANVVSGIDFVTHSLGGILVRALRVQFPQVAIRRVVMLSPPNQGSEVVDALGDWSLFKAIVGPAGRQLGTGPMSVPNALGAVDFEVGVVAGNTSLNPLLSWLVPRPNDGPVAVRSTRVEGMTDFIIVSASHTFITYNADAIHQARQFVLHGRFDHARSATDTG